MREKSVSYKILVVIGIIVALIAIFPLIWMGISGFKMEAEVLSVPFKLLPSKFVLDNYQKLFQDIIFFRAIGVTFLVAAIASILSLALNSMAAYAFARLEFRFKKILWFYIVMTMFIPGICILIPSYIVVAKLHMLNTLAVLIIPGIASAYSIFFIRQFYLNIPRSIEEAALIDGASKFEIYLRIFLPLSKGPFTIIGVGTFLGYWNSFLWPIMTISDEKLYQIMQLMKFFRSEHNNNWAMVLSGSTIAAIPTIILFLIFQKNIIQGIKISGLK
jgi:multiple sugar transport system permease protein